MAAPNILCDTAGMTNAQWLAARMHGPSGKIPYTVGGSDVAAVFGVSPWTTPLELWMIKKGRMKPPTKSNANQLEMGHLLEPIAAHWYAKKTGNRVYEDTNLYQHADHPYALANFDRRFERASDGEPGILECKSCTYHKASEWDDGAIPLYYELQLRFYLAVADVNIGSFSAIWGNNPDNDLAIPDITRDKAKEDMIFERLDEWIWSLEHRNDQPLFYSQHAIMACCVYRCKTCREAVCFLPAVVACQKEAWKWTTDRIIPNGMSYGQSLLGGLKQLLSERKLITCGNMRIVRKSYPTRIYQRQNFLIWRSASHGQKSQGCSPLMILRRNG